MANIVSSFVVIDGIIHATLLRDGSLVLATCNDGENGQVTYREEMTLSSGGVKTLVNYLTRVAEQRDAPVHAAIELLRKIQNKDDAGKDYISEETHEEIDAVLKTAAGG